MMKDYWYDAFRRALTWAILPWGLLACGGGGATLSEALEVPLIENIFSLGPTQNIQGINAIKVFINGAQPKTPIGTFDQVNITVTRYKSASTAAVASNLDTVILVFSGDYRGCNFTLLSKGPIPDALKTVMASRYGGRFVGVKGFELTAQDPSGLPMLNLTREGRELPSFGC